MAKTNNLTIEQTTALRAIARDLGLIATSGTHAGDGSVKKLFDGLAAGTLRVVPIEPIICQESEENTQDSS